MSKYENCFFPNVSALKQEILNGGLGRLPSQLSATGASFICQTTQLAPSTVRYLNYYLIIRLEGYFGACVHMPDQLNMNVVSEIAGNSIEHAIEDKRLPVQIAAMDAYLGTVRPHEKYCTEAVTLPKGTAIERAEGRDALISRIANIKANQKVALIGVVNPLIKAINDAGGVCLPCDLQLKTTQWGDPIEHDMETVLDQADNVICTAMTLGNGTFDRVIERVRERKIPLTIYAQTGSAIAAQFVGNGVTNLVAETFPFSQFSPYDTTVYCYRS